MTKSQANRSYLILAGFAVLLAGALFVAWHYAGLSSVKPPPPAPAQVAKAPEAQPSLTPGGQAAPAAAMQGQGPAERLTTVEEGDMMIDEIIRSNKEIPAMARDLHELVRKLNSEAQVNASRHLVNLTSDEDYGLISSFLVDAKMNPEVIEVLFADLMNRKRELQMPLFMNILRNPQHPQNEQVRNVMTVLAGQDFGQDYAAWDRWANETIKAEKGE